MSRFEEIGVSYQRNSASKSEADKRFSSSCRICASHGICVACDRCAIAAAHDFVLGCFDLSQSIGSKLLNRV